MSAISIVIPTHNREGVLRKALEGYLVQTAVESIRELLVVDDGSTDNTEAMVREVAERAPFEIVYLRQDKKGPAAARNVGIKQARADLILFTDSDIVPDRELVGQHLQTHSKNPQASVAVLGYVTWPPDPTPTPFMRWYGEHGPLFGFASLRRQDKREVGWGFFYSCNVSLKGEYLRTYGQFDEDFKWAAYEDFELAYRLNKAGLRLLYNSAAVGYHHQFFSFADACQKARMREQAERVFSQKEAGKQLNDQIRKRRLRLGYRLAKWVALRSEFAMRPFWRLVDSTFPLPPFVYHLLFWYSVTRSIEVL